MKRLIAILVFIALDLVSLQASAVSAEKFRRLSGPQIRAQFTGMLFTDEVHWGEVYESNGRLTSMGMGTKRVGTWKIQNNQLCRDLGNDPESDCYEVWAFRNKVELRTSDSVRLPLEGILEKPQLEMKREVIREIKR